MSFGWRDGLQTVGLMLSIEGTLQSATVSVHAMGWMADTGGVWQFLVLTVVPDDGSEPIDLLRCGAVTG